MKLITVLNKKTNQLEEIAEPGIRIHDGGDFVIPVCNSTECKYNHKPYKNICLSSEWLCDNLIKYKSQ